MELLLNINQYEYKEFLNSNVSTLIIALKNFSCGYLKEYELNDLEDIINMVHNLPLVRTSRIYIREKI